MVIRRCREEPSKGFRNKFPQRSFPIKRERMEIGQVQGRLRLLDDVESLVGALSRGSAILAWDTDVAVPVDVEVPIPGGRISSPRGRCLVQYVVTTEIHTALRSQQRGSRESGEQADKIKDAPAVV